jgi:hypothetical protein
LQGLGEIRNEKRQKTEKPVSFPPKNRKNDGFYSLKLPG